jgi:cytoskeleton protein RodZ
MDIGETLRLAREQRGISLETLSQKTKINPIALRALEENDIQKLPGGIFLRGFLRAYAREVGLDVEETVNRYVAQFEPRQTAADEGAFDAGSAEVANAVAKAQRTEPRREVSVLGMAAIIVLGLSLLAYMTLRQPQMASQPPVAPPPPDLSRLGAPAIPATSQAEAGTTGTQETPGASTPETGDRPAPSESLQAETQAGAATSIPTLQPATAPAQGGDPLATAPQQDAVTVPAPGAGAAGTAPPEPPAASASDGSSLGLTIQTTGPCWVSVVVDGRTIVYRLMQAGEQQAIDSGKDVVLRVGDPGVFSYSINGAAGRALGPAGSPTTVRITSDNYQEFVDQPAP